MDTSVLLVFAIHVISASHAGHVGVIVGPSEPGAVIQGPGSKTSLVGPDGSHISAAVAGGTVVAPPKAGGIVSASVSPGYVASTSPVVAAVPVLGTVLHPGIGLAGLGLAAAPGSGLEGQYVHDNTELLYDDGSYKGTAYDSHY